jgi:5-methylcytosine-specific restriction endonuclease McrBC GTP-binding regulatory subunit McrB
MKRKTGPLVACIKQAADPYSSRKPDERVGSPVRCLLQGKLLTGLYLMPGEATEMTLQRFGEAVSVQARISPSPLEQRSAILEYDETGAGTVINDRQVVGTLCLEGETEPAVFIYRPDPHTPQVQQQ